MWPSNRGIRKRLKNNDMNLFKKWMRHDDKEQLAGPGEAAGAGEPLGLGEPAESRELVGPDEPEDVAEDAEDGAEEADKNTPKELHYLRQLIRYRLVLEFHPPSAVAEPVMPPVEEWDLHLGTFIKEYPEQNAEAIGPDEARLLLIGLVHHIQPDLFDQVIDSMLKGAGDFPKIGGVRGKDFRGFMPTGETALFLLAGYEWQRRLAIQRLFWADHFFARKRILWLEEIAPGEPVMSGRITLSRDYIDIFTHNKTAPPHFGISFPAKPVNTDRKREDLVIDSELNAQLDNLLDWMKYHQGLVKKGGQDGRFRNGYRVLFYGPSGTGKTFAACLLGKETGKEVYRVDLAMVVSKYIGETEKNLELLFARAESKKWILFFDEADALFGKRTNVKDSHDKYANQEVSYLLQRIEDYDGLVILATNMKNNIDEAFIRRFNSILKFSMPGPEERKKIWKKTLPGDALFKEYLPEEKLPEEKAFDLAETVKKYELSGGNIVNIVHYAGIKALKRQEEDIPPEQRKDGDPLTIYLADVMEGIRHELNKSGIPFNAKERPRKRRAHQPSAGQNSIR